MTRHYPRLYRLAVCVGALLLAAGAVQAKPWWMRGSASNDTDFLPPDVAFRLSGNVDGDIIRLRWIIADGYYLYRHKIEVKAESPDLIVSAPGLPDGTIKTDPYLGRQEIYTQQVDARVAYSRFDAGAHPIQVKVTYQGCAEAGLCYPPITKVIFPTAAAGTGAAPAAGSQRSAMAKEPFPWQSIAMVGGIVGFFIAGLVLRRARRIPTPTS